MFSLLRLAALGIIAFGGEKVGMRNAREVVREVGINDFRVAAKQLRFHLGHRLLGISPGTVGLLLRWKIGLKDRF